MLALSTEAGWLGRVPAGGELPRPAGSPSEQHRRPRKQHRAAAGSTGAGGQGAGGAQPMWHMPRQHGASLRVLLVRCVRARAKRVLWESLYGIVQVLEYFDGLFCLLDAEGITLEGNVSVGLRLEPWERYLWVCVAIM